jgi:sugar/nucleoside kinase (ribokinase family)
MQNLLKKDLLSENITQELEKLRHNYDFESIVTTLGSKGCVLSNKNNSKKFETEKVGVNDVTGAGDNFIATLAFLLWKNKSIIESIDISLKYATESVKHVGNFFDDIMNIKE